MDFQMDEKSRREYISRRRNELPALAAALLNKNFRALETAGHQIKGSARSYGFDSLTSIATNLEDSAREENTEGTTAALRALEIAVKMLHL